LITGSKHGAYETHKWIPPLEEFLRQAYGKQIPIVGVCFGHQILAQALGGTVEKFSGGWVVGKQTYAINGQQGNCDLMAWHQEKRFGKVPARAIAEENGAILPPSLRRDVVFQLSYDLIGKIIELQEQVADAADPVAMLEREHAGWQQELPLPLENETAEALLNNLVRESWKLSITNKIRWRRLLRKKGEEWQLEQVLELPRRLTGEALAQWCNTGAVTDAVRLRILLQVEGEQRQVGLLTLIAGNNDEKIYHCEGVSGREVRLTGRRALAAAPLFISDGRNRYQLPVSGDQELGPLPWFFAIRKNENMFIGDGTVRTGSESVLAVVPAGGEFQGEAAVEPVGEIPSCSREIVKIAGSGSWMKQETGTVGFRCGATEAKATTLVLAGPMSRKVLEKVTTTDLSMRVSRG